MNKNGKTIAMILGLALSAVMPFAAQAQAVAAKPGFYLGAGIGTADAWDYNCDALPTCKKKGSAYRFFGGWQFSRNFAVEATYADFGKVSSSNGGNFDENIKVSAGDVTLVGVWHALETLGFYGRVGGYYSQSTRTTTQSGVTTTTKEGRGNPTIAGGFQWYMTGGLALRGEGQRYVKVGGGTIGDSDYTLYSLNLLYKF
ncbi:MAG: outer membrane beta-barrel protein [Betaproteobacteria bacterium]|nr:outer membrane beta-barrel protein [Betaproteobacteria bacterium]MBV9359866.1 outer membrane beta-barrel protein [Betaproteobacteria bacterium]